MQLSAGKSEHNGGGLYHTNMEGKYWCGHTHERTPEQLLRECQSTIVDLYKNHPELKLEVESVELAKNLMNFADHLRKLGDFNKSNLLNGAAIKLLENAGAPTIGAAAEQDIANLSQKWRKKVLVLQSYNIEGIESKINAAIQDGYELRGSVAFLRHKEQISTSLFYTATMVLKETA